MTPPSTVLQVITEMRCVAVAAREDAVEWREQFGDPARARQFDEEARQLTRWANALEALDYSSSASFLRDRGSARP